MVAVPISNSEVERLKKPVGTVVLYWGLVDVVVTEAAIRTFAILGQPDSSKMVHVPFSKRMEVLKKNLQHPKLELLRAHMARASPAIEKIKGVRDFLMHGVPVTYDPEIDSIAFSKIDRLGKNEASRLVHTTASHKLQKMIISFQELEGVAADLEGLHAVLEEFLAQMDALLEEKT